MAVGNTYNSNENQVSCSVYSPISFANSESKLGATKFSINYYNKILKVSIASKMTNNQQGSYESYDNKNAVTVYVSFAKAKLLLDMIRHMKANSDDVHNVCIDLKGGLLLISDGAEYGSTQPVFVIKTVDEANNVSEVVYETKVDYYKGIYNYSKSDNTFTEKIFNSFELDALEMTLEQYYLASSYAVAASVMEAGMYKHNYISTSLQAIAAKVGAQLGNKGSAGSGGNSTFLGATGGGSSSGSYESNTSGSSSFNSGNGGIGNGSFETTTMDDLYNNMK